MFSRSKNEKLYLNDTPINFNIKKKLKQESVIATGFPSGGSYDEKSLMNFVYKVQDYKKVRLLGSAALSLAWVSINRIDSYSEKGIYLWDVAAGLALNNCFDSNLVIENYICNITI